MSLLSTPTPPTSLKDQPAGNFAQSALARYLNFPLPTIIETFLLVVASVCRQYKSARARSRLKLKRGGDHAPRGQSRDRHRRCARHGRGGGAALRPGRRQGRRCRRVSEQAQAVAADIRAAGGEAIAASIDVTSEPAWVALIEKTVARYGRLDILVNNAGISGSSVGDPDGLEGWHRIIAVNQTSVFLGTKLAMTGGGSIVNISSIMVFVGGASGHPAYSASKGAVRSIRNRRRYA